MPDDHRLLLQILVSTGMRLDEAALRNWEDLQEEDGIMFFNITGTEKRVKNIGSRGKVPVPTELEHQLNVLRGKGPVFPGFKRDADGKAQVSAGAALRPYIRQPTNHHRKVVHNLRGSIKDRLRDAGVSKEVNDFITGHGSGDVAGSYGSGPSLRVRKEAIDLAELRYQS